MKEKFRTFVSSVDFSGMMLSLSGVILGVLLAVSDYKVDWEPAVAVVVTSILIQMYMSSDSRLMLLFSSACAVLTVWLSFGKLFLLESLLLLLFSWFVLRLARGIKDSGRLSEAVVNCLLYGPIAFFGTYFVCTHSFGFWLLLLPALSVGLLCVAAEGLADGYRKNAVAFLTISALVLMTVFSFMRIFHPAHFIYAVTIPVFVVIIFRMYMNKGNDIMAYRPSLAFCTLAFAVLTGLGFVEYLF